MWAGDRPHNAIIVSEYDDFMTKRRLKLGLLVNPLAGLGGSVALKGSDGAAAAEALARGAQPRASEKAARALRYLAAEFTPELLCWGGEMGEAAVADD